MILNAELQSPPQAYAKTEGPPTLSPGDVILDKLLSSVDEEGDCLYEVTFRFVGQTVVKGRCVKNLTLIAVKKLTGGPHESPD